MSAPRLEAPTPQALELWLVRVRTFLREPGVLFWVFGFPVLLAVALGIAFRGKGPERMAVVFDTGRDSFRKEIYPEYKANRPPAPDELQIQMPYFRQLAEGFRWPVLAVPGVEADDVIATLVTKAKAKGWDVVVYSADKDMMQLVGEGAEVIDAMRQQVYTREAVTEKFVRLHLEIGIESLIELRDSGESVKHLRFE